MPRTKRRFKKDVPNSDKTLEIIDGSALKVSKKITFVLFYLFRQYVRFNCYT